ncbi:hypothetical protein ABLN64_13390 [Mycobacterium tuberculosis]
MEWQEAGGRVGHVDLDAQPGSLDASAAQHIAMFTTVNTSDPDTVMRSRPLVNGGRAMMARRAGAAGGGGRARWQRSAVTPRDVAPGGR